MTDRRRRPRSRVRTRNPARQFDDGENESPFEERDDEFFGGGDKAESEEK